MGACWCRNQEWLHALHHSTIHLVPDSHCIINGLKRIPLISVSGFAGFSAFATALSINA